MTIILGLDPGESRFWNKVEKSAECWNWTACKSRDGYGMFHIGGRAGRVFRAHRVSYELLIGPIPNGLQLDHLCRNRACVNPDHLEPVTSKINTMRGETPARLNSEKTECPSGHPYSGWNLINYRGRRYCRACTYITRDKARGKVAA